MPAATRAPRADATITLRLPAATRDLIDQAAAAQGKSRTEFMLDSARRQAEDALLDQRLLLLDEDAFAAFSKALDEPAPASDALKALMARKAPWEA